MGGGCAACRGEERVRLKVFRRRAEVPPSRSGQETRCEGREQYRRQPRSSQPDGTAPMATDSKQKQGWESGGACTGRRWEQAPKPKAAAFKRNPLVRAAAPRPSRQLPTYQPHPAAWVLVQAGGMQSQHNRIEELKSP